MILHLSAPLGSSGNDGIDKDQFPIQYSTVDEAISLVTSFGVGAVMAKVDLQAAFRMVPVSPADWDLLGMQWQRKYYVDTCLPFGLRSAPFLFNQFAEVLNWILCQNYQVMAIHYLDDFLIVGAPGSSGSVCGLNLADLGSLRQAGHSGSTGQIGRALHDHHLPWHPIGFSSSGPLAPLEQGF